MSSRVPCTRPSRPISAQPVEARRSSPVIDAPLAAFVGSNDILNMLRDVAPLAIVQKIP